MKLKFNKSNLLPPIGKLTEFLRYDPSAGLIIWRKHYSSVLAGEIAGSPKTSTGAIHIGIFNKVYLAHRIAWALYHWRDPHPFMIDHKDGDRTNNKINNLRIADYSENNCNARIRKDNKSGIKGVCFHKRTGKWQATLKKDNTVFYLGLYLTIAEAAAAMETARNDHHLEFARHA